MLRKYHSSILFFIILLFGNRAAAQNLFANSSFEDINICVEFNAACASEGWFYIKPTTNPLVNRDVVPTPVSGMNLLLVPMENIYAKKEFNALYVHQFVYTMLCCPLVKDKKYELAFFIHTGGRKFYSLDFCFTSTEPATDGFDMSKQAPSFTLLPSDLGADTLQGWKKVNYSFIATGKEKFCIIGNFSPQPFGYKPKDRMNTTGAVYYFLDELTLLSADSLPLCKKYEDNIKKLYEQNYRHTNFAAVQDPADTLPEMIQPLFVTDTIVVPNALFQTASARLRPAFTKLMDSLTVRLKEKKIAKIAIIGHTDNRGIAEKNMELSLARAESVREYFNNKLPKYNDIIVTSGKGQEQPVADNNTESGRTKNRRVEIILTIPDTEH